MLRRALATPTRSADAAGVLVVGTALHLVAAVVVVLWSLLALATPVALLVAPVAFAPLLVLRGYYVRVVSAGLGDVPGAPAFVGWGGLYRDGLKSALLSAAYLLPLAVIAAVGVTAAAFVRRGRVDLSFVGGVPVSPAGVDAVVAVVGAFVAVVTVGYLVGYLFVRPAALACFADTGRLRDGLRLGRVLRVAFSGDYVAGWLLAMVVALGGLVVAAPFVPLLLGVALVFLARVVVHSLYGRGAARRLGHRETTEPATATRTAGSGTHRSVAADPTTAGAVTAESGTGTVSPVTTEPVAADELQIKPVPSEADPDVQVGRTVPLTATDILSASAVAESERGEGTERGEEGDAASEDEFEWGPR